MQKYYTKGKYLPFSTNYSAVVIRIYCALKIEKTVNQKNLVLFSFLWLCFIRKTYSKYLQNSISGAYISSETQKWIT